MTEFLHENLGTIVAFLAVALLVFLAVRRMVLDKKAGIGACGQKCSTCAKFASCEQSKTEQAPSPQGSMCSGVCSGCERYSSCHKYR